MFFPNKNAFSKIADVNQDMCKGYRMTFTPQLGKNQEKSKSSADCFWEFGDQHLIILP